jgi:hypothetical protein
MRVVLQGLVGFVSQSIFFVAIFRRAERRQGFPNRSEIFFGRRTARKSFVMAINAVTVGIGLTSCANLEVYRAPQSEFDKPVTGKMPYNLARTAIIVTGTLALNKCNSDRDKFEFDIDVNLTTQPITEADPSYQYFVDHAQMRGLLKNVDYKVNNYPNRTLQSFTGSVDDQAGQTLVNAVTTAIKIAGAAAIPGLKTLTANEDKGEYCEEETSKGAKIVADALRDIDEARKKKIEIAKNTEPDKAKNQLALQDTIIQTAQDQITKAKKDYNLVRTFVYRWVPRSNQDKDESKSTSEHIAFRRTILLESIIEPWFRAKGVDWIKNKTHAAQKIELLLLANRRSLANSEKMNSWAARESNFAYRDGAQGGLVIRDAEIGVLRVCKTECVVVDVSNSDATQGQKASGKNATTKDARRKLDDTTTESSRQNVALPQFGAIHILPLQNIMFENTKLSVTMNPDGTIGTIGYSSLTTAAAGVKDLGGAAQARIDMIKAQNDARDVAAKYPATYNKSLADCLAQAKDAEGKGGVPIPCQ